MFDPFERSDQSNHNQSNPFDDYFNTENKFVLLEDADRVFVFVMMFRVDKMWCYVMDDNSREIISRPEALTVEDIQEYIHNLEEEYEMEIPQRFLTKVNEFYAGKNSAFHVTFRLIDEYALRNEETDPHFENDAIAGLLYFPSFADCSGVVKSYFAPNSYEIFSEIATADDVKAVEKVAGVLKEAQRRTQETEAKTSIAKYLEKLEEIKALGLLSKRLSGNL